MGHHLTASLYEAFMSTTAETKRAAYHHFYRIVRKLSSLYPGPLSSFSCQSVAGFCHKRLTMQEKQPQNTP
jgi:hypothetical protein